MNKKHLSEDDISVKFITQALINAGWDETQIRRHPRVGKTPKPTKKINYRFLGRARGLLKAAVSEFNAAGF